MYGKLSKCESVFHEALHQVWAISRIQLNINERTALYLTAGIFVWSSLLKFLPFSKWQKYVFPSCAHSIKWLVQEHSLLLPIPISQYPSLRTWSSCWNVCVQDYFKTFPRVLCFLSFGERKTRLTREWWRIC